MRVWGEVGSTCIGGKIQAVIGKPLPGWPTTTRSHSGAGPPRPFVYVRYFNHDTLIQLYCCCYLYTHARTRGYVCILAPLNDISSLASYFRSVLTALYVPMWYSSCLSSLTVPVPDSIRCLSFCQVKVEHFFFSFFFFSTMFNLYTCIFFFLLFFPGVISKYPSMYPNRFLFADYITFK